MHRVAIVLALTSGIAAADLVDSHHGVAVGFAGRF
jgi:hypothetical protein